MRQRCVPAVLGFTLGLCAGCASGGQPAATPTPVGAASAPPASRAAPASSPADAADVQYFQDNAAVWQRGDLAAVRAIDFRRFRRGSMLATVPTSDHELDMELKKGIESHDDEKVLAAARATVSQNAAYIRGHVVASNVLRKQGKNDQADIHRAFVKGMFDSIMASGDGKTKTTAFTVYSVREEYDLAMALELDVLGQALQQDGGRVYDVLTVRPDSKEKSVLTREMFFDITELYAQEAKAFGP
jgi:hypothetical protein